VNDSRESGVGRLSTLTNALREFCRLDKKMQVSTILALLEVAAADERGEEITVGDVERNVGMLSGTTTRNVRYWGEGHEDVRGEHRFIELVPDSADRRRRLLKLTPRGRKFVAVITSVVDR
jgi:DNA-binding MarR family transcriptional regulator